MLQTLRLRLFVILASRGFALAADIEQPFPGNESNGVPCLMSGIQRFASPCLMFSGHSFVEIENSYTILPLLELTSSGAGCRPITAWCRLYSSYPIRLVAH